MGTPHKHRDLIKAWADGAVIEHYRVGFGWEECSFNTPCWSQATNYRIKPQIIKYRVALLKVGDVVYTNSYNDVAYAERCSKEKDFVKWLGDWQEVEM